MKLLSLEIGLLPNDKRFRSLHAGFKVQFHSTDPKGTSAMASFSPFCLAGLNGSGKSNVLEALAAIFYHLECCVSKFKPETFERHFKTSQSNPDAYRLEYLIGQIDGQPYILENFQKIVVTKEIGKDPVMTRQQYPFENPDTIFPVSLSPRFDTTFPQPAEAKSYLPDIIVGYSSGENEILSLPFRKSRLINYDKYRQDYIQRYKYEEPENSLIYIDNGMSQAVLLACLLFEDVDTLRPLRNELGITGMRSFRINLNIQNILINEGVRERTYAPILQHIPEIIDSLKKCATSWHEQSDNLKEVNENISSIVTLDYLVTDATKDAFRNHFSTSFELFRIFQMLYELNAVIVSEAVKEEAYKSKGFYTDGKLPEGAASDNVFYFLDFLIEKDVNGEGLPIPLLLREFSDGEHQFLHTMGICLMLKHRRSLLLLDEPETHFNPSWRAKFIKILSDSVMLGGKQGELTADINVHLYKDILLTSHSPFIISDCMPRNVIFFDRNEDTKRVQARKASDLGFNTYGTSVELILDELFNYRQSIGDLSNDVLNNIDFEDVKSDEDVANVKKLFSHLGDSIEKDMVLARLNQLKSN